jgi:outer membrane protein OmpA-like peptidoglycan-associated protein
MSAPPLRQWPDRRCVLGAGMAALAAPSAFAQGMTDAEGTRILRSLAPQDRLGGLGAGPARAPRRVITVVIDRSGIREEIRLDLSRMVDVTVFFANNSASLGGGAQRVLSVLAGALRHDVLADQRFLVAGHTNSVGARDHNLGLSATRARTVRDWLVSVGAIQPDRLLAHGFGPDLLRRPDDPASPVNRRVEVVAIDD